MLQLNNQTELSAGFCLFADETGIDTLYVVLKATFELTETPVLSPQQLPIQQQDSFYGELNHSSLQYPSEAHLSKPATDIMVLGHVWAPDQTEVTELDAGLRIADQLRCPIKVFGDRIWQSGEISEPQPFLKIPLLYERAYGGRDPHDSTEIDPRNPVGRGFVLPPKMIEVSRIKSFFKKPKMDLQSFEGVPLPNLENPHQLIRRITDRPKPMNLGAVLPAWQPRKDYAGTLDQDWQTQRAPYLPKDFDSRFFNLAHPQLIYPGFLQGGEIIELYNLSQAGHINFKLPQLKPDIQVHLRNKKHSIAANIETLLIEPDEQRFSLTWRAQLACDKNLPDNKKITVSIPSNEPKKLPDEPQKEWWHDAV